MEPEEPPEHASPSELIPCKCCGRKFNQETLDRHEGICIKTKKKDATRKAFDSSKHRAMGTDLEAFKRYNKTADDRLKMIAYERQAQKKKQWKRKHEEFVNTIRSAREYDAATKTGISLPPPEPSVPNPDYVQCPYCKRRFQEHAAERHIPFCKEQNSRIDRNQNGSSGSGVLTKRLKYKPPNIRNRSETEGRSAYHQPPGSSLIPRKTNLQATYNVGERSPGSNYFQGERRLNGAPGPRTHNMAHKPPSGGPATHYPGNNPQGHFKPHPPNKLPPPNRLQGRLVHGTRRIEMVNHSGLANGYQSGSDEQGDVDYTRKPRNTDQFTRKGGGDEEEDNQLHSSSRGSLPKIGQQHSDFAPNAPPIIGRSQLQERVERANSNSSLGIRSIASSKHSQLNIHGMTMSKFCYECGSGFPVPQAKYCCECGTKRI